MAHPSPADAGGSRDRLAHLIAAPSFIEGAFVWFFSEFRER